MSDNALTVLEPADSTELALPLDLIESARKFQANARARGTQIYYGKLFSYYCDWCRETGVDPVPPDGIPTRDTPIRETPEYRGLIQTVGLYVAHLATKGGKKGKPQAISTISSTIAAIKADRAQRGLSSEPLKDPRFKELVKGVNRQIGSKRTVRRVSPLTSDHLGDLLRTLDPQVPIDARDAAILAIGFGCARRRSEIVFLDYEAMGDYHDDDPRKARGFLTIDPKGVYVRLLVSKTNQDGGQEEMYVISREAAPKLCAAVENWIKVGRIEKGTPLFRYVKNVGGAGSRGKSKRSGYYGVSWSKNAEKWQGVLRHDGKMVYAGYHDDARDAHLAICRKVGIKPQKAAYDFDAVSDRRLSDGGAVARMVKGRVAQWFKSQPGNKRSTAEELKAFASTFSGHSLRSGLVTDAANRGVPDHQIQATTGHRDIKMISVYKRETDKLRNSPLKGADL